MAPAFLTIDETAKRLGVTASDVRELARAGNLDEVQERGRTLFRAQQVERLASSAPRPGTAARGKGSPPPDVDLGMIGSLVDDPARQPKAPGNGPGDSKRGERRP